jgi:formate dehydrogenase subunit delta
MSHEEGARAGTDEKIVRMANQIATFFSSKPHEEAVTGTAEHINKFWDPRMRSKLFALLEKGDAGFSPLVVEAAAHVRPPRQPTSAEQAPQAEADVRR